MANNLHRWANSQTLEGSAIDTKSTIGFQPNDYLQSSVFNTILKETSLVSQMIGEYVGGNIDVNTTTSALLTAFQNKISNSTVAKATNLDLLSGSTQGEYIVYQNDDNTTGALTPNGNNKVLTYDDRLKWTNINSLPILSSSTWQTANGNAIAVSEVGYYLVKATISTLKDDSSISDITINELFCITELGKEIDGKIVYTKLISGSTSGNNVSGACQLRFNGRNIVCYIQSITSSTTLMNLVNFTHSSTYDANVKLEYKKIN